MVANELYKLGLTSEEKAILHIEENKAIKNKKAFLVMCLNDNESISDVLGDNETWVMKIVARIESNNKILVRASVDDKNYGVYVMMNGRRSKQRKVV